MISGGDSACDLKSGNRRFTPRNRSSYHSIGISGLWPPCSSSWPPPSAIVSSIFLKISSNPRAYPSDASEGYALGFEEIFRKIEETMALGGGQLLLQGGHNPDIPIEWYEDLFRGVKRRFPDFKSHALSPPEIIHISR